MLRREVIISKPVDEVAKYKNLHAKTIDEGIFVLDISLRQIEPAILSVSVVGESVEIRGIDRTLDVNSPPDYRTCRNQDCFGGCKWTEAKLVVPDFAASPNPGERRGKCYAENEINAFLCMENKKNWISDDRLENGNLRVEVVDVG